MLLLTALQHFAGIMQKSSRITLQRYNRSYNAVFYPRQIVTKAAIFQRMLTQERCNDVVHA